MVYCEGYCEGESYHIEDPLGHHYDGDPPSCGPYSPKLSNHPVASGLILPELLINVRMVYDTTVADVAGHFRQKRLKARLIRMLHVRMERRSRRIDQT